MASNVEDLTVYKEFKLRDCMKLPRAWAKQACRYKKIRRKAEREDPPGINVLFCGILQTMVSKKVCFIDEATEIVRGNIPEDSILALTGAALCDAGHYEDGLKRLRKAVELQPSLTNMEALAGCIEKPEDYSEKLGLSNRILEKYPNDVDALRHKAFVLVHYGNLDEAEELMRKALNVSPKNGANKEGLGEILFRRGMYKEALQLYKKAYPYLDRSKYSWQQIAHCYFQLGEHKKAKKAALKMLKAAKKEGVNLDTPTMKVFLNKFEIDL